ncbi:hypothetical protein [Deinococcus sp. 23YEL01]|uniref:beta strand repeat-containing protein n=1 Tax=Deinococcus sp. 23YEL01 TaxID=2745871 RepID=UPI001E2EE9ED|nr:hypothetical protein [Deinococcus sp. 23YEL01]MCD0169222.1 hypothetical protein [Deinococcus sp. 23YEL01]
MTMNARMPALILLTLTLAACGGGGTGTPTPVGTPVTNLADSGAGSLRDTLAAAKSGDTLRLTSTGTLTLASPLTIDRDVTIIATGVTIDAAGKGRALDVAKGAAVTMQGGTLKGGTGGVLPASVTGQAVTVTYGGVLSNAGTLTLDGVTVTGGKANMGGGIYNMEGATLTLKGSTNVTGNEATLADPADGALRQGGGGGILNLGVLTVSGGSVTANKSFNGGGGIRSEVGSRLTMTAGSVSNNACTGPLVEVTGGDYTGCTGGGIHARGTISLSGGTVGGNTATYLGGGVAALATCKTTACDSYTLPTFEMSGDTVIENNTLTGAQVNDGGGLWLHAMSNIIGGTIRGNKAMYGGGLSVRHELQFTGATIEGNTASAGGGGLMVSGDATQATLLGGTIKGNTSKTGGGVAISEDSKLTVKGGTVTQNTATANGGGLRTWRGSIDVQGGTISSNRADAEGGAISTEERGNVTVSGGLIENNTAGTWGGGINVRTEAAGLTVTGGTLRGNTAGKDGGGISAGRTINLAGATIEGNKATGGGGGVFMGVWNATTPMAATFGSGLIIRNNAATTGGGLQFLSSNAANATLTLNATISGNTATQWGGGIVGEAIINMMGGSINGNRATGTGQNQGGVGGVQLYAGANMTATGGIISDNEGRWAGGVQVSPPYGDKPAAQFTLAGATISGNRATEYNSGGINNGGKLTITAGSVTGNTAKMNGGGVFNSRTSTFTQSGGSVTGNNPNNVFNEQ